MAGDDPYRMARFQLARLLEELAPDNYRARQWGPLRRVRMGDNTYRWMCDEHARKMGKQVVVLNLRGCERESECEVP